jgi:predicted HTH domain antitoxin
VGRAEGWGRKERSSWGGAVVAGQVWKDPRFQDNRVVGATRIAVIGLDLDDDLLRILGEIRQPVGDAAREVIVMELYRRGKISSGRGAELLGLSRLDFIQRASDLGIPYLRVNADDLDRELRLGRSL